MKLQQQPFLLHYICCLKLFLPQGRLIALSYFSLQFLFLDKKTSPATPNGLEMFLLFSKQ